MLKCGVPCTSEVHIWVAHELRVGPAWTLDHDTGLHSTGRKQVQRSQIASASKSESASNSATSKHTMNAGAACQRQQGQKSEQKPASDHERSKNRIPGRVCGIRCTAGVSRRALDAPSYQTPLQEAAHADDTAPLTTFRRRTLPFACGLPCPAALVRSIA